MVQIREIDRRVTWVLKRHHYEKTTVLVERIPIDEVLTCEYCGNPIFEAKENQLYCTMRCRVAAHRMKKKRQENGSHD